MFWGALIAGGLSLLSSRNQGRQQQAAAQQANAALEARMAEIRARYAAIRGELFGSDPLDVYSGLMGESFRAFEASRDPLLEGFSSAEAGIEEAIAAGTAAINRAGEITEAGYDQAQRELQSAGVASGEIIRQQGLAEAERARSMAGRMGLMSSTGAGGGALLQSGLALGALGERVGAQRSGIERERTRARAQQELALGDLAFRGRQGLADLAVAKGGALSQLEQLLAGQMLARSEAFAGLGQSETSLLAGQSLPAFEPSSGSILSNAILQGIGTGYGAYQEFKED